MISEDIRVIGELLGLLGKDPALRTPGVPAEVVVAALGDVISDVPDSLIELYAAMGSGYIADQQLNSPEHVPELSLTMRESVEDYRSVEYLRPMVSGDLDLLSGPILDIGGDAYRRVVMASDLESLVAACQVDTFAVAPLAPSLEAYVACCRALVEAGEILVDVERFGRVPVTTWSVAEGSFDEWKAVHGPTVSSILRDYGCTPWAYGIDNEIHPLLPRDG